LNDIRLSRDKEDVWVWKGGLTHDYSISQVYDRLQGIIFGEGNEMFIELCKVQTLPLAQHFRLESVH